LIAGGIDRENKRRGADIGILFGEKNRDFVSVEPF
jgi:hypothetical protein